MGLWFYVYVVDLIPTFQQKHKTLIAQHGSVQMPGNMVTKSVPTKKIDSLQYDLFTRFVTNDKSKVSNIVALWEAIPKYFITPAQAEKQRSSDGLARSVKWNYAFEGHDCVIKIQPAEIEQADGSVKAEFPGATEELVEEALKKIFSDQRNGIHDPGKSESWVKFSLRMVHAELKQRKRTRDISQIKNAIEIMSGCILTFYMDGKELWKGAILQDLVTVGRKDYLADSSSHHIARLPLFISKAINSMGYRQFNYDALMTCNEQLSRWIFRRMAIKFIQAGPENTYHLLYSTINENSALLQQSTASRNRQKVISALKELKAQGSIAKYETEPKKHGRKIVDVKYTIYPSKKFILDQKAANKRQRVHKDLLSTV